MKEAKNIPIQETYIFNNYFIYVIKYTPCTPLVADNAEDNDILASSNCLTFKPTFRLKSVNREEIGLIIGLHNIKKPSILET